MNDAENRTFTRVNINTGKYEPFWQPYKTRPAGERNSVYGMYSDSQNNGIFCNFSNSHIGIANAKTGNVTLYPTISNFARPRRGRVAKGDIFWFAQYRTDKVGMFDINTKEMKEWDLPVKYASPYDVVPDKNGEIWTGNDQDDRITRLDPKTGNTIQYLMPHETNVRRVFVDNKTARPTFWVGSNHTASIFKVEPLD
jgi:streptogramin lyase